MLKNYLKIAFRNLAKNKMFVIINILGLGIAIACSIVAYLNYQFSSSYDLEHEEKEVIYRINSERVFQGRSTKMGYVPHPVGDLLDENIEEINQVTNYIPLRGNIRIKEDLFNANITYVEQEFFNIFNFEWIYGEPNLSQPSNIYLSDQLAEKYFGEENPIGKEIIHVLDSGTINYYVAGVFKKKTNNSSFNFVESFTSFDNYYRSNPDVKPDDWLYWTTVFIQVNEASKIPLIENHLKQYLEPQNQAKEDFQITRYYLDPLVGMASRDEKDDISSATANGMPSAAVSAPIIMSSLILLLACFNFTNTSLAISGKRLKEIGLRKVMGGLRSQLIRQFLVENILLCLMAMLVGLIIAEFLAKAYSSLWPFLTLNVSYFDNLDLLLFLFLLLIFTGIIAGSYPAFYISKFQPASILKGSLKFGGTSPLTRTLLTLQFSIALLAIISGFAFVQNAHFQKNFDLGYEGDGVIQVDLGNSNRFEIFKNAVINNPLVKSHSGTEHQIMSYLRNDPVKYEGIEEEVDIYAVDENYLETMDIDLLQGRNFKPDSKTDREESIIVTEKFVRLFGWDEPMGKRVVWMDTVQLYVVGVIEDVYTNALWSELDPMMLRYAAPENYRYFIARTDPGNIIETNKYLEKQWKNLFPDKIYPGFYLSQEVSESATVNNNILKMFLFLGSVATVLALSGLFTLVSLNILKRIKEIAVRKVLGASIGNIAIKLNFQFIIILCIAIILSSALSYFMIDGLMDSIWTYHIEMNFLIFMISGISFLLVSIATVGAKVFRAASMNPVNALRNE